MSKQRLTITLSKSTLNKVDRLIDSKKIRSRSHAIETLLEKALQPKIELAVILAGDKDGRYKQIRTLTKVNKQPLIVYTLKRLKKHGIKKVIVLTNDRGKEIKKVVDQYNFDLKFKWFFEKKPLGTAGAIKQAASQIDKTFLCLHSDVLTDINFNELIQFHENHHATATIAVKPRIPQDSYDNVYIQGSKVVDFKPKKDGQLVSIVNSGVYIFEPDIINVIPNKIPATLEQDVFPQLAKNKEINAFTFQGIWFDVSTDQNYKQVLNKIKN
ncbi:MAG: sugar phosphate nucleotidyltransferase [Patescibacteria group bacterium]|nr:sugar phosphate nucleotidyltransferase [Patescibacteria group bacterium]